MKKKTEWMYDKYKNWVPACAQCDNEFCPYGRVGNTTDNDGVNYTRTDCDQFSSIRDGFAFGKELPIVISDDIPF